VSISERMTEMRVARIEREILILNSMHTRVVAWSAIKDILVVLAISLAFVTILRYKLGANWSTFDLVAFALLVAVFGFFLFLIAPAPTSRSGVVIRILFCASFLDLFTDRAETPQMSRTEMLQLRIERAIAKRKRLLGLKLEELRH
jgi:hypothetical protein